MISAEPAHKSVPVVPKLSRSETFWRWARRDGFWQGIVLGATGLVAIPCMIALPVGAYFWLVSLLGAPWGWLTWFGLMMLVGWMVSLANGT